MVPLDELIDQMKIELIAETEDTLEFDLIGVDVSVANALRRIMLSNVPTMAIETCEMYQNTGVIQDEILCHRLCLIPFSVDPDLFDFRNSDCGLNSNNSLQFSLNVVCPQEIKCMPIYSRHLQWIPRNNEEKHKFKNINVRPVSEDILITKIGPGQEIDMFMYLEKGIGATHAKWSPVCVAYYKLKSILQLQKFKG
ncbi:DNA-directed RNA polymerases I and III subunit RPAC1-like [Dermatophagoides farinae]|uniref:DNA-directed RNA polymerases I and III subunit RPAC1-like n=1 Tax=Dermatophagoides farinae TaxID=6954 RepID=UPI003F5ED616